MPCIHEVTVQLRFLMRNRPTPQKVIQIIQIVRDMFHGVQYILRAGI
ncbi:hypothetical protein H845_98 [Komagataeibacter xylinus E25]|nr:hypothetical protein H845_98 [Komagataeibacter xylinus E25]